MSTSTEKQAPFVSEAEAKLMWTLLKIKGVSGTNWDEVASVLNPANPEQKGTVSKRWSRLQTRLSALDEPAADGNGDEDGAAEPKTPKKKRATKGDDNDETPKKKRRATPKKKGSASLEEVAEEENEV